MALVTDSLQAEAGILGAMMLSADAADRALSILTPQAFFQRANCKTFEAIRDLRKRGDPPELVLVVNELRARDELDLCGGTSSIAGLLEYASPRENIDVLARVVRSDHARRERVKVGLWIANEGKDDPEATREALARLEAVQRAVDGSESSAQKWAAAAMTGQNLVDASFPPLPSWLGDGILPAGELAFLTGHSGVGKTFLIVQLMSALSTGHTFNGLPTRSCRVGLVELEMPWASIQKRVASLHSGDFEQMAFLCSPPGALHVREAEARDNLAEFCRRFALDVLILDPFNRLHDDDENSGSDMGHVLEGLHELRRQTGVAILALHHIRKMPSGAPTTGAPSRTSALDAGRGSSRLTNDPATVMALDESKGFVRLTFAKVRHAQAPPTIHLKRNEAGFFDVADDPALARERRCDALTQMLERAGQEGITSELAAEVLKVTERTIQRDLASVGAVKIARGKNSRVWVLQDERGELPL